MSSILNFILGTDKDMQTYMVLQGIVVIYLLGMGYYELERHKFDVVQETVQSGDL